MNTETAETIIFPSLPQIKLQETEDYGQLRILIPDKEPFFRDLHFGKIYAAYSDKKDKQETPKGIVEESQINIYRNNSKLY